MISIPIPPEDQERIKVLRKTAAMGEAAAHQVKGYFDALLIGAGVEPGPELQVKLTDTDVLVLTP